MQTAVPHPQNSTTKASWKQRKLLYAPDPFMYAQAQSTCQLLSAHPLFRSVPLGMMCTALMMLRANPHDVCDPFHVLIGLCVVHSYLLPGCCLGSLLFRLLSGLAICLLLSRQESNTAITPTRHVQATHSPAPIRPRQSACSKQRSGLLHVQFTDWESCLRVRPTV